MGEKKIQFSRPCGELGATQRLAVRILERHGLASQPLDHGVQAANFLFRGVDELVRAVQRHVNRQRRDGQEGGGDVASAVHRAVVEQHDLERLREGGRGVAAPRYLQLLAARVRRG